MKLRNRMIKASFWTDTDLIRHLDREGRMFYIGLTQLADDSGCLDDDLLAFKIHLYPADMDVNLDYIKKYRDKLVEMGKVIPYTVNEKDCLYLKNFHKHQTLKNAQPPNVPLPSWVKWEPYGSNESAGKYVVNEDALNAFLDASYDVLSDDLDSSDEVLSGPLEPSSNINQSNINKSNSNKEKEREGEGESASGFATTETATEENPLPSGHTAGESFSRCNPEPGPDNDALTDNPEADMNVATDTALDGMIPEHLRDNPNIRFNESGVLRDFTVEWRTPETVPREEAFLELSTKEQLNMIVKEHRRRFPAQYKKYGTGAAVKAREVFAQAIAEGLNPFKIYIQVCYWDEEHDGPDPPPWRVVQPLKDLGPVPMDSRTMQYVRYSMDLQAVTTGVQIYGPAISEADNA